MYAEFSQGLPTRAGQTNCFILNLDNGSFLAHMRKLKFDLEILLERLLRIIQSISHPYPVLWVEWLPYLVMLLKHYGCDA